jgi:DNA polymerase-2
MPEGFILHPTYRIEQGRPVVHLFGKLETGETFAVRDDRIRPFIFILRDDGERAARLTRFEIQPTDLTTMDGRPVSRIVLDVPPSTPPLRDLLMKEGIACFEADIPFATRYLIEKNLRGSLRIEGEARNGRLVHSIYENPDLAPSAWVPELSVLSIDIETDSQVNRILSIGMRMGGEAEVHLVMPGPPKRSLPPAARIYPDEVGLLKGAQQRIRELDPDVITGWNVIDFDLAFVEERCRRFGLPFTWGRADLPSRVRTDRTSWGASRAILPGRVVLDGLSLLRGAFIRMEDYRLETVAREVLGEGKTITKADRGAEIERLYTTDLDAFVEYNLTDARLVLEILERLQLIPLTIRRSLLTGMPMDRVAASIASFDFLYISELGRRGMVAPSVDREIPVRPTAGGHVLDSVPGLFENILVFDYKSLYPSIIRTFHLDPLTLLRDGNGRDPRVVTAPNGARFRTTGGILPDMLGRLFPEREAAKRRGDHVAATALKILMNSFYGVLATPRCRFYSSETANAITHFGQMILLWTRDRVEKEGLRVLYGDTDSIFVESAVADPSEAQAFGERLADRLNASMASYIREGYGVESHLELQFETLYRQFFMPGLRHSKEGSKKRYAGVVEKDGERRLVFRGLESVRRDWTEVSKAFQKELLTMVFSEGAEVARNRAEDFVRRFVAELRDGGMDHLLVYRKALRKDVSEYTKTTPPHVKAARQMGERAGRIVSYVMTAQGPQPADDLTSPPDYEHYIEKQIRPVAEAVFQHLGLGWDRIFSGQSELPF